MNKPMINRWDEYCRSVNIGLVNVSQSKSLDDLTKAEKPQINWSAIGAVGIKEVQGFIQDLDRAVILATLLKDKSIPWCHPPVGSKKLVIRGIVGVKIKNSGEMTLWMPKRTPTK